MKFARLAPILLSVGLLALSIGIFTNISDSQAAFGTSPPWIRNDHLLPGSTLEETIRISRSNTEKAMKLNIEVDGDKKFLDWIKVVDQDDLVIKEGQSIIPMKVIIEVPEKAELKQYIGAIFVTLSPLEEENSLGGGEVGIALGVNISIDITVTGEKVYNYQVKSISANRILEGTPFSVNVKVQNDGNVAVGNVNGQIDIYNENQSEIVKSLDFITLDKAISANETKSSRMVFEDTILEAGKYWVFVKTFQDGKVDYENRLPLEVVAKTVPVVTPEAAESSKPSLPSLPEEKETEETKVVEVAATELRPAATESNDTNNIFLIFGLAGLGFGMIAVIGVMIALIFVLRGQRTTPIITYPAQGPMMPPQPMQPVQPASPQMQQTVQNQPEESKMNTHAEN